MQVANDVASAKELPSREPAQAGALTIPLPESCRAASSARIASRALWSVVCWLRARRSRRTRPAASRRPWRPERRDAGVPASKLRCDEGLDGKTQQGVCYLGVHLQWRVQPVHRAASARAASRAAVVTAEGGCDL